MSERRSHSKLWLDSMFHSPGLMSSVPVGITSWLLQKSQFIKEALNIIAVDIWS